MKEIEITELEAVWLSIQFLESEHEKKAVFTDYGLGIIQGLFSDDTDKKCQVIHKNEYHKLAKKYEKIIKENKELREVNKKLVDKVNFINKRSK